MDDKSASGVRFKDYSLLAVIGGLLFFINLGATRLWDIDEAIFTQSAREMYERHDWVTPYFNGALFGHKPPVMYWFQILAFGLFGVNEFAARFFSGVFGIGTMWVTYELGRMLFSRRAGMWSAVALASSINYTVIARAATPDAYLTFFCTLALAALVWGSRRIGETNWRPQLPAPWKAYALAYAAMAAAVLVKGPVGIVLPMAVWGLFLLIEQRRQGEPVLHAGGWIKRALELFWPPYFVKTVWRMRPLTALLMLAAIAAPWYVWVGLRTDGAFLHEFFYVHNFERAAKPMENHSGPFYYYLLAICIGTFPWCMLLAPMLLLMVRNVRDRLAGQASATLLMCWAGVWVGAFTLVGTKLPSYIMPAYPALALGFGALVDHWLAQPNLVECRRWLRSAWATTAVVGPGICIVVPIVTHMFLSGEWTPALVGLVPLVGAIVGWRFVQQHNHVRSLQTLAATAVLFGIGLLSFAVLPIDAHQNSERFAKRMRRLSEGPPHVAAISYSPPSLIYYIGTPITKVDTAEQIVEFFHQHPNDAYLVTTGKTLENLTGHLPEGLRVIDRDRRFLRKGEIVVLGRREETQVARRLETVRE